MVNWQNKYNHQKLHIYDSYILKYDKYDTNIIDNYVMLETSHRISTNDVGR